jgi:hypothetical protein
VAIYNVVVQRRKHHSVWIAWVSALSGLHRPRGRGVKRSAEQQSTSFLLLCRSDARQLTRYLSFCISDSRLLEQWRCLDMTPYDISLTSTSVRTLWIVLCLCHVDQKANSVSGNIASFSGNDIKTSNFCMSWKFWLVLRLVLHIEIVLL